MCSSSKLCLMIVVERVVLMDFLLIIIIITHDCGHVMVNFWTDLMVCILTCKCLQFVFLPQAPTPQQRDMMEEAAARIAQDNCELACCFIQKTAVEKAGPEMDKRLATVRHFEDEPPQFLHFSSQFTPCYCSSCFLDFSFPCRSLSWGSMHVKRDAATVTQLSWPTRLSVCLSRSDWRCNELNLLHLVTFFSLTWKTFTPTFCSPRDCVAGRRRRSEAVGSLRGICQERSRVPA